MTPSSDSLRLWIVNQYAITPDMPGGRRHLELASLLSQKGWTPTIWATPQNYVLSNSARPISITAPARSELVGSVAFKWLFSLPYTENNWRRYANMASFATVLTAAGIFQRRPDVIIGSSPHLLAALSAWMLARRYRVPFVLEIRDLWPETLVQLGLSSKPLIRVLESIERFLYSKADVIVPLTEGIANGIERKGFGDKKMVLIPNASLRPKPLDSEEREAMRRSMGWSDKTVAIWIGAHGPANGLDVIIEAARLLVDHDDLLFVMIGGGADKPRLKELARGMSNVLFLDPVSKDAVDNYLRAADIGLLVHRDTAAVKGARPNKLFDYMAAALPIVLNMDGEARRLAMEAGAGVYVPAERPDSLAAAVLDLYRKPEHRNQLGNSGFQHVAHAHSREDTAEIMDRTLREVLESWNVKNA